MLLTALVNAICLHNAWVFIAIDFCIVIYTNDFCFHVLFLRY